MHFDVFQHLISHQHGTKDSGECSIQPLNLNLLQADVTSCPLHHLAWEFGSMEESPPAILLPDNATSFRFHFLHK